MKHIGIGEREREQRRNTERRVLESGEAASAEEITQCSAVEEEPAYGRCEARYAEREREREKGTKMYISIIKSMQQLQMNNNNLCKRLQSHFI